LPAAGPARKCRTSTKYAYEAKDCYGLSAEELGKNVPPDPHSTSLNKREIAALADYVIATFVGK
jgi:hypothetical protein